MSKIPQVKEFDGFPVVTAEKMKYLDKKASMEYGVASDVLMENAGRAVAQAVVEFAAAGLGKRPAGLKAVVCCGKGNNGGDGLTAARYLKQAGAEVKVFILPPKETGYGELVVKNLAAAKAAGVPVEMTAKEGLDALSAAFSGADLLVDALLGISAVGKPAGPVHRVIQLMNKSGRPIVAVDLPSGLSADTGHHSGVFIIARLTLTLGFAKSGLMAAHAQKNTGVIKVLPIGYPAKLIDEARRT
ncbi:MAG: NAD(P)H-hydrate epimerase [Elusimicrobia bacterium CG_4_10_14_0_2_um_filter_56_8]|nr:MAG: NAD(P)H-hydrate epimerase [Elusimicrobia bacterium CG1_02_56_21]PJA13956.1 MAG: NAD(P)H-hydrate epimerase [Elusimicrobia bacterium CG_4_10_14_0_2_um_filter_56_8]